MRRRVVFAPWLVVAVLATTAMAEDSATKAACRYTADCEGENHECIESRCMCNPMWAHSGSKCNEPSWTSWALAGVLGTVSVFSVLVLASAAKRLSTAPSRYGSGLPQLATMFLKCQEEEDSGTTTVRVMIVSVVIDIINYVWIILTAVGVVSNGNSAFWQARVLLPISEGLMVLPAAIVVSVWMDVANSSMSRTKSKKKLERTKRVLQFGTALYTVLLLLMSTFGQTGLAMLAQLGAIGVGLTACGSGAAKLCNTLRAMGGTSASIADTVFKVSRSMGVSLYIIFMGKAMMLSSRTRKSNPANLALLGVLVSTFAKCFLNKAIFEYMVESTRAKRARTIASAKWKATPFLNLKPAACLVSPLRSVRKRKMNVIAVDVQGFGGLANDAGFVADSSTDKSEYTPKLPPAKNGDKVKDEQEFISEGAGTEVKKESDEVQAFRG